MHAWVFRHRHGLRSVYGLPPEPRLAGLIARARRASRARASANELGRDDSAERAGVESEGAPTDGCDAGRVRQRTIRPHPRRA